MKPPSPEATAADSDDTEKASSDAISRTMPESTAEPRAAGDMDVNTAAGNEAAIEDSASGEAGKAPSSLFTADDFSPPLAFEAATSGGAAATPRALPNGSVEVAVHPIFSICKAQGSPQSYLPLNGLVEVLVCTTRLHLLRHLRVPPRETGTHARRTWFPFLRRCVCGFTLPSFPPSWFRHVRQYKADNR